MTALCVVLAIACIMLQLQVYELRRKLNAMSDAASALLEDCPDA